MPRLSSPAKSSRENDWGPAITLVAKTFFLLCSFLGHCLAANASGTLVLSILLVGRFVFSLAKKSLDLAAWQFDQIVSELFSFSACSKSFHRRWTCSSPSCSASLFPLASVRVLLHPVAFPRQCF
eukprot:GHVT01009455.1.p2 GENE.GHVT01009455.1~~GHVT01009455.1.p2  ORF type:complete len:125 (+),score=16.60 GHVT01009455.1:1668-2042(+)